MNITMNTRSWKLGFVLAASSCALLVAFTRQTPVPAHNPVLPAPVPAVPFPDELLSFGSERIQPNAIAPHLRQSVSFDVGDEGIEVKWRETDGSAPIVWHPSDVYESTTYRVTAACGLKGGEVIYVAGIAPNGADVIERFNYGVRVGGYRIQPTSPAAQPIGTAMAPYTAQEVLNGTSFVVPPSQHGPARRTLIYTGNAVEHVRAMDVDPEGRYLVLLGYKTPALHQIDLSATTITPVKIFDATQIPHLPLVRTLRIRHHATYGRTIVLSEQSGSLFPNDYKWTLVSDATNDGVFERKATLTTTAWAAAGFDQDSNWSSYQNVGVLFNW